MPLTMGTLPYSGLTHRFPSRPSSFLSSFDISGLGFSTGSVLFISVDAGTGPWPAGLAAGEAPGVILAPTAGFIPGTGLPEQILQLDYVIINMALVIKLSAVHKTF
jgi:hypothetical protein